MAFNRSNLFITRRFLAAKKRQNLLAIAGVVLGVSAFIAMVSFMGGVNDFLDRAVFDGNPDIVVKAEEVLYRKTTLAGTFSFTGFKNTADIDSLLKTEKNVAACARQTSSAAIIIGKTAQVPAIVNGIFEAEEEKMASIDQRLLAGRGFKSLKEKNSILLGAGLAEQLKVDLSDKIKVVLPNGRGRWLKINGIFSFGIGTIDNLRAFMAAEAVQDILEQSRAITHFHIKLKNRDDTSLKNKLMAVLPNTHISDWKDQNQAIVIGNQVRDVLTWSVSLALLIVAGLGIYNTLNILVVQKYKDIAILKTLGCNDTDLLAIFLMYSGFIGLVGGLIGTLFGYFISYFISTIPINTRDVLILDSYPVNFEWSYYIWALFFGLLTSLISGYIPALKAGKSKPVEILRGLG